VSHIDDLIAQLCPGGVEVRRLADTCSVLNGYAFKSDLFNQDRNGLPLIRIRDVNTGFSETYYSGEYDDRYLVADGDVLVGMDGDFRSIRWSNGPALLNQRVCRLQDFSPDVVRDYLYYYVPRELRRIQEDTQQSTVKHLSSKELLRARIPVPPLEVQHEVVRVLDAFTALDAKLASELKAELEARRWQYEHYRDSLLSFVASEGVPRMRLSELGSLYGGLTGKAKADFSNGNARFVSYTNVFNTLATNTSPGEVVAMRPDERQNRVRYGDVLFTGSSETAEEVGMSSAVTVEPEEPLYLNSFCFGFRPNNISDLDPEFAKHLFRSAEIRRQIIRTANGVTRINISKTRFRDVEIPVPPIYQQQHLATLLDKFNALVNDLSIELPAELHARRQQYEHYRDRLLTFSEAE
jgi:type I restriction enzyme, S subunit